MFTPHHVSHVRCHMSHVTCQVSGVTCQVSPVRYHILFFYFFSGQSGEASWWRVCYQRGLPRLVHRAEQHQLCYSETAGISYLTHILSLQSDSLKYLGLFQFTRPLRKRNRNQNSFDTMISWSKEMQFPKHRPSGPMLSISRNVHMCVCVSVCLFTF